MTDDNSNIENNVDIDDADDLDAFAEELFQTKKEEETPEVTNEEEVDDHSLGEDDDPPAPDDDNEDEPDPEEDEKPEPKGKKKNTFQERINELTAKAKDAERAAEAERLEKQKLIQRLEQLEAAVKKDNKEEKPAPKPLSALDADAPQPDALDEDGEPIYPLGEFDPKFIKALTEYSIEKKTAEIEARKESERIQKEVEAAREELKIEWQDKLAKAEAELPDLRQSIVGLVDTFSDLDDAYGEYLATTLMASEYGPEIMYYLSQNIGEAQKIVASGPAAATLALGRLEARFVKNTAEEEKKGDKKVTAAQEPPPINRGSNGKFSVAPDTDDLDAFEREFYKKR